MPSSVVPAFLDTAYLYALLNSRDEWHAAALFWQERLAGQRRPLVTTEFVLVEFADGLASLRFRSEAARTIAALRSRLSLHRRTCFSAPCACSSNGTTRDGA